MAVDAGYRDKDGEISRKHGNTLIGTLRITYGSGFAKGCADSEKLSDVLAALDERSEAMTPRRFPPPWTVDHSPSTRRQRSSRISSAMLVGLPADL